MKLTGYSIDRIVQHIKDGVAAQDEAATMESVSELIIKVVESSNFGVAKDLSKVSMTPPAGMFEVPSGTILTFSGRLSQGSDPDKVGGTVKLREFDPDKIQQNGGKKQPPKQGQDNKTPETVPGDEKKEDQPPF